jgi:hypothetical protein
VHAERTQGVDTGPPDRVELRATDVARQHDTPLDPRMLEHCQGRRHVVVDRVPHHLAGDEHAVEGELIADHELLDQRRIRGGRR